VAVANDEWLAASDSQLTVFKPISIALVIITQLLAVLCDTGLSKRITIYADQPRKAMQYLSLMVMIIMIHIDSFSLTDQWFQRLYRVLAVVVLIDVVVKVIPIRHCIASDLIAFCRDIIHNLSKSLS